MFRLLNLSVDKKKAKIKRIFEEKKSVTIRDQSQFVQGIWAIESVTISINFINAGDRIASVSFEILNLAC